jgi:hypothetical protein
VKISKVSKDGKEHILDANLKKFFGKTDFGHLNLPMTILDRFGRVMTWALPRVLHLNRVVSQRT